VKTRQDPAFIREKPVGGKPAEHRLPYFVQIKTGFVPARMVESPGFG
jgi:hypothetical protein